MMRQAMSYINEIRQLVGTRPLIMVGATLLIVNQQDQLLMIKRTDNGCWGVPGGAMEPEESLENTVRRETLEELGVDVGEVELFGVYYGQDLYYKYPNGAEVYNVSAVYLTRGTESSIHLNPEEHSEYHYFDIHHLPLEVSPPIKPVLRDLTNKWQKKGKQKESIV